MGPVETPWYSKDFNWAHFIVYAGFYMSLRNQRFQPLNKPSSCIKKADFMQPFYLLVYQNDRPFE